MRAKNKRRITEMTLQKAKATDGRVLRIWDNLCLGLVLFVYPSGAKSFRFFFSFNRRPRWYHLGPVYLADARRICAKLRAKIAEGIDPVAERHSSRQNMTFTDLAARYLEVAKRKNKSWKQAAYLVDRHLVPTWGRLDVTSITRADVRAMMTQIKAPNLANKTHVAASAIFSWAVRQEIVTVNPCKGVETNPTKSRERILSDSEVAAFWRACDSLEATHAAALRVLLLTGQRRSEVSAMHSSSIKNGWWEMSGPEVPELGWPGTKNKKNHRVWLSEPVRDIIATIRACSGSEHMHENGDSGAATPAICSRAGFVFGRAVTSLDKDMREICQRLGIARVTPHDLRRTYGSTVTRLGHGRAAMDRLLNHSDSSAGATYDRYAYEREDRQIMEDVAQHIMAIVEGREGDTVVRGRFPNH
jgi:integrase